MNGYRFFIWLCLCFCSVSLANKSIATTHVFKLENGLTVVFRADHRAPVVLTEIWYKVGSSDEPNGLTGISHALEHMMFEGTSQHKEGEFNELITGNGGIFNASTSFDFTNYFEKLAADKLPLSLSLEADRMQHLQFTQAAFKKELQVVLEERRMRTDDNPVMLTYERFMAAANLSNPYHHMPIGWSSDIQHLTKDNLHHWYQQWYAPNNAVLVIVGDTTLKQVKQLTQTYFADIDRHELPKLKPHPPQVPLGQRKVAISLPAHVSTVIMGYSVPSVLTSDVAWEPYALEMLAGLLDGGNSAKISKDLVRGKAIATQAGVSYNLYSKYSQQFVFSGVPSQGHTTNELIAAFKKQIENLQTTLVSGDERQRIINQIIAAKIYSQDSIVNQANEIGRMVSLGLSWNEMDHYLKMIKKITPEQIQTVAKKYLVAKRLTLATLTPTTTHDK